MNDRFLLSLRHAEARARQLSEYTARYRASNDSSFLEGRRPARTAEEIDGEKTK